MQNILTNLPSKHNECREGIKKC